MDEGQHAASEIGQGIPVESVDFRVVPAASAMGFLTIAGLVAARRGRR